MATGLVVLFVGFANLAGAQQQEVVPRNTWFDLTQWVNITPPSDNEVRDGKFFWGKVNCQGDWKYYVGVRLAETSATKLRPFIAPAWRFKFEVNDNVKTPQVKFDSQLNPILRLTTAQKKEHDEILAKLGRHKH